MKRREFIAKMRDILRKRRDGLRQALRGELTQLTSAETGVGDSLDLAQDSDCDEICSQLAEAESRELEGIERALERMRKGRYGACEGCGHDIPSARLQALPYATHCVRCQRHTERSHTVDGRRFDWSAMRASDEEEVDLESYQKYESEIS